MKTKIFNKIPALAIIVLLALSFNSCQKDTGFIDFSGVGNVVDMPQSGAAFFSADAITASGIDTLKFAVELSSPNTLSTPLSVIVGVDNTIIPTYNAANPAIVYNPFPSNAYTFPDVTVTIPAGQRVVYLTCVVNKAVLNPALSYMLPISIKSAPGVTISGNFGVHYYHVIGNDFAGSYSWDFTRVPAAGNFVGHTTTIYPVSPTQFEVAGGYYTGTIRYECTFTKNSDGTYSNFQVFINTDDATNILNANGISISIPASIVFPGYSPTTHYTFLQATTGLFTFQYQVFNGSSYRLNTDKYYH